MGKGNEQGLIALVRQAIFTVLDEASPRTPGLQWDFTDDEQRVDFADRVVSFIPSETGTTNAGGSGVKGSGDEVKDSPPAPSFDKVDAAYVIQKLRQRSDAYHHERHSGFYSNGDAALDSEAALLLEQLTKSAGLRSAESYECQIKAQHQVIAERDATIASLRSHEQPIDIEERIRWHKSEARRLTLESIRGGQPSDIVVDASPSGDVE
jgi:hypothetical protein